MTRRLQSTDSLLAPAVREAISVLNLGSEDAAMVRLAERYAAQIDAAATTAAAQTVLADLGPKLLVALESLGASPRARAGLKGGNGGQGGRGKLSAIRAARSA